MRLSDLRRGRSTSWPWKIGRRLVRLPGARDAELRKRKEKMEEAFWQRVALSAFTTPRSSKNPNSALVNRCKHQTQISIEVANDLQMRHFGQRTDQRWMMDEPAMHNAKQPIESMNSLQLSIEKSNISFAVGIHSNSRRCSGKPMPRDMESSLKSTQFATRRLYCCRKHLHLTLEQTYSSCARLQSLRKFSTKDNLWRCLQSVVKMGKANLNTLLALDG